MTKYFKFKALALVVLLTATSCNKWLDLKPEDGLVRENFWATKEQLKSAVVGIYTSLNGGLALNLFYWGELRADMATTTAFSNNNEIDFNTDQILATNPLTNWSTLYTTINYCNTVIENGPNVIKRDNTLTQLELNGYMAEARGIRALMYFYLLRIWGEVPLQLNSSSSDSKIQQLPKSSKEDVAKQIKADVDFAALNAADTYGDDASNKGRITQMAMFALQADLALWTENYADCITACDKIINSNRYGLIDGSTQGIWYNTLYEKGNSAESIFEFQFDNQFLNSFYTPMATSTKRLQASTAVGEMYSLDPSDPVADIRGDAASYRSADGIIWKQVGTSTANVISQNNSFRHWFVYRYADILLMKAEALAWTNKGADAIALINTVRTRAKAQVSTQEAPNPNTPVEVSDYILHERAREFAFEGKRWFDLLRHAKRNNYAHKDLIMTALIKVAPIDKQKSILDKMNDTRSHYLPITQTEITADKLLVQNPFYQ